MSEQAQGEAWFYGRGGYFGEPDYTGPEQLESLQEARLRWNANYDVEGPFPTEAAAQQHLDEWLEHGDGDDDAPQSAGKERAG